eukprot:m.337912 g.337912  ORF g.337912 m.337912 type:complete len:552 (-) comp18268_c0_seq1:2172-3827(-)
MMVKFLSFAIVLLTLPFANTLLGLDNFINFFDNQCEVWVHDYNDTYVVYALHDGFYYGSGESGSDSGFFFDPCEQSEEPEVPEFEDEGGTLEAQLEWEDWEERGPGVVDEDENGDCRVDTTSNDPFEFSEIDEEEDQHIFEEAGCEVLDDNGSGFTRERRQIVGVPFTSSLTHDNNPKCATALCQGLITGVPGIEPTTYKNINTNEDAVKLVGFLRFLGKRPALWQRLEGGELVVYTQSMLATSQLTPDVIISNVVAAGQRVLEGGSTGTETSKASFDTLHALWYNWHECETLKTHAVSEGCIVHTPEFPAMHYVLAPDGSSSVLSPQYPATQFSKRISKEELAGYRPRNDGVGYLDDRKSSNLLENYCHFCPSACPPVAGGPLAVNDAKLPPPQLKIFDDIFGCLLRTENEAFVIHRDGTRSKLKFGSISTFSLASKFLDVSIDLVNKYPKRLPGYSLHHGYWPTLELYSCQPGVCGCSQEGIPVETMLPTPYFGQKELSSSCPIPPFLNIPTFTHTSTTSTTTFTTGPKKGCCRRRYHRFTHILKREGQ